MCLFTLLGGTRVYADNYIKGTWDNWDENEWTNCKFDYSGGTTGTVTLYLRTGYYEFKFVDGGTWMGNDGVMTCGNSTGWTFASGKGNCGIEAPISGNYTFNVTWSGATPSLSVVYPSGTVTVYLYNDLGWETPYAYILGSSYWDKDNGSGSEGKSSGIAMTKVGESNIWKAEYTLSSATRYIAFVEGQQDNYKNFWQTKAIYRDDFNAGSPLYVPDNTKSGTYNETDYYNNGSWQYVITPGKEYTTYVTLDKADFTGLELKAYKATSADASGVVFDEVGAVPANTPLLLKGTAGTTYNVPVAASADAIDDNKLVAGDGTTTIGGDSNYDYILSDGSFYRANEGTVAVGKAYLHLDSDPLAGSVDGKLSIIFNDSETNGIKSIENRELRSEYSDYFNLAGQKVGKNYKGIVIVNGKKMLNK